ncbi:MAG: hypothetical protein ACRC4W_03605 [Treponemataceae bacterium]
MKSKGNIVIFIVLGIIFCIFYTFLAIKSLNTELYFNPLWTITLDQQDILEEELLESTFQDEVFPFKLKNHLGYFSHDGFLLLSKSFSDRATITADFWATYANNNSEITVFDRFNEAQATISAEGFPFFQEDRYYVFHPGGNSVSEYSAEGDQIWTSESFSPIVAFNSSQMGAVIGFADGKLVYLNPEGEETASFYPGGSKYEIILGAAIAPNSNLIAIVSGINKQRFILYQLAENQIKVLYHHYLSKDIRAQTFMKFNAEGTIVYFNDSEGLGVLDCKSLKATHIPMDGKILAIEEVKNTEFVCVLAKNSQGYKVSALEKNGNLLGSFSFPATHAFISSGKNQLFLGRDDKISSIAFSRR